MPVHLVRHACAGNKRQWSGPDLDRPLDGTGLDQADALADDLDAVPVDRIFTSPAARCHQTVEPLALRRDLPIEPLAGLLPDGDVEYLRGLAAALDSSAAVVCVHGELMRPLLATVRQAGGTDRSTRLLTQVELASSFHGRPTRHSDCRASEGTDVAVRRVGATVEDVEVGRTRCTAAPG